MLAIICCARRLQNTRIGPVSPHTSIEKSSRIYGIYSKVNIFAMVVPVMMETKLKIISQKKEEQKCRLRTGDGAETCGEEDARWRMDGR